MVSVRSRFEVLVATRLSPAVLASFGVRLTPTVVPRSTMHRLRVDGDRDIAEVVERLTERDVEVLEIRKCPAEPVHRRPRPRTGVVVPLHAVLGSGLVAR